VHRSIRLFVALVLLVGLGGRAQFVFGEPWSTECAVAASDAHADLIGIADTRRPDASIATRMPGRIIQAAAWRSFEPPVVSARSRDRRPPVRRRRTPAARARVGDPDPLS
jgi:hypothetical protein